MLSGLLLFFWRFLPDRCEQIGCTRRGVRGNENVVFVGDSRRLMCDECAQIHIIRRNKWENFAATQGRAIDALNEDQP